MTHTKNHRYIGMILAIVFGLSACSQEGNEGTEQIQIEAYLSVAELYRNQGQFRASIIEAQNALQINPGFQRTRIFIAQLYMDLGDNGQAIESLTELVERNPNNFEEATLLAEAHLNSGNPEIALTFLDNLSSENPTEQNRLNWLRGNAYAVTGDRQSAVEAFQSTLANDSNHLDTLISLSKLEYSDGNLASSTDYLNSAAAIDSSNLELLIWRGQFAILQEQYAEAEEFLFAALNIMGNYDTMTAKRFSVLQTVLIPLQMQQKNGEAQRYAQIIAGTPQGQFQNNFNSALSFFEAGNFEEAEQTLNGILASSPDHQGSNVMLGMTQYAQGNYAAAEQSFASIASIEGTSPQIIKTLAATHLRLNQPERALAVLNEAISAYPGDGSLFAMVGVSQQSMGNIQESIESFAQAIELQPESADIHYALAGSYFLSDDLENAVANLNETLRINPQFEAAKTTLVDLYLSQKNFELARASVQSWLNQNTGAPIDSILAGRVAFVEGNNSEARQFFSSVLGANPSNVLAKLYLARIDLLDQNYLQAQSGFMSVLEIEQNNVEALTGILAMGELSGSQDARVSDLRRIIDENPTEFTPPLVLSQYYVNRNQLANAMEFAQIAYARNDNRFTKNTVLEIYVRQINTARQEEDLATASQILVEALELQDDNVQVLTVAAGLANDLGNRDEAQAYVDRIQALVPGSAYGFEIEGDLLVARNEPENALAAFERAWSINITSTTGVKLHRLLSAANRTQDADRVLSQWLEALPNDGAANLLQAVTYQQNNQEPEAIRHYEVAVLAQPNNLVVLNNLAWIYQDSSPARALELANHAAELYPENPDVLDTYGWILYKHGNRALSIATLERALALAPDSEAIAGHLNIASQ